MVLKTHVFADPCSHLRIEMLETRQFRDHHDKELKKWQRNIDHSWAKPKGFSNPSDHFTIWKGLGPGKIVGLSIGVGIAEGLDGCLRQILRMDRLALAFRPVHQWEKSKLLEK